MLTALGIFAMAGAGWFGYASCNLELSKGSGWEILVLSGALVSASLACLALAYLCFGGGW